MTITSGTNLDVTTGAATSITTGASFTQTVGAAYNQSVGNAYEQLIGGAGAAPESSSSAEHGARGGGQSLISSCLPPAMNRWAMM
jgi:hypothetical protein